MITTQPFYIGGLDDPDDARSSAFGAAGMFLATFVLSVIGIWYDGRFGDKKEDDVTGGPEANVLSAEATAGYGAM